MTASVRLTLTLSLILGFSNSASARDTRIVRAPAGPVRGEASGGLRIFRGLPYAAPPVERLRWRPPVPAPVWHTARDATRFGPAHRVNKLS